MLNVKRLHDLTWLAGLFEGEASFSRQKTSKNAYSPRFDLCMIDRDTVERVAQLLNTSVHMVFNVKTRFGRMPQWRTAFQGKKAMLLAMMIYPWLGARRRDQVKTMWEHYRAMPSKGWRRGISD